MYVRHGVCMLYLCTLRFYSDIVHHIVLSADRQNTNCLKKSTGVVKSVFFDYT